MTDATFTPLDVAPFDRGRLSERHSNWTIAGAGAVSIAVLVGSWLLDHHQAHLEPTAPARLAAAFRAPPPAALPDLPGSAPPLDPRAARLSAAFQAAPARALPDLPAVAPTRAAAADPALLDSGLALGGAPVGLSGSAPLPSRFEPQQPGPAVAAAEPPAGEGAPVAALDMPRTENPHDEAPAPPPGAVADLRPEVETVPLPAPRPSLPSAAAPGPDRAPRRQTARLEAPAPVPPGAAPAAPADNRGFLEKFFGAFRAPGSALGYAAPEDGLFGRAGLPGGPATPRDRFTAVYDISAHTVYMPDGSKLEAHSGLGGMMDDPRSVHARNTGATPPHLYDLTMRESLFHGVQALRLTPVGGGGVYGRDGLLAHTYMLGASGQSNGCVSFRDYQAFLRAYQNGQVRRLVVVAGGMS